MDNIKHDSHAVGMVPPVPQSGLARRRKRRHALRYALAYLEVRSPQPMLGKTFPNPSFGQPLVPGCFSFRCLGSSLYHERLPERFLRKGRRRLGKRRCWIPKLGRARNPRRSDRYTSQSRRVSQSPQKMPRNIDGRRHGIPHVGHILWDPKKVGKQWPWLVDGKGTSHKPYLLRFLPAAVRFRRQGSDPKLFLKGQPSKRRGKGLLQRQRAKPSERRVSSCRLLRRPLPRHLLLRFRRRPTRALPRMPSRISKQWPQEQGKRSVRVARPSTRRAASWSDCFPF